MGVGFPRIFEGQKPVAAMVLSQVLSSGNNILFQMAVINGMHPSILAFYRYLIAAVSLAPIAFFIERKRRPGMTWKILLQAFFSGLLGGTLPQNIFLVSIKMTSATYTTAIGNLLPAMTFVLVIILRLERLKIRTIGGQAKVIGTIVGIGGAMLLTFYQGPVVTLWPRSFDLLKGHRDRSPQPVLSHETGSHILGSLLAIACTLCIAIWMIIQAFISKVYPCPYSMTALMCFMASVQSFVFAIFMERDWNQWKIGYDIRLLTILYAGVVGSGLVFSLQFWCINKKGPLFTVVFNPLILVIVALFSSLLLKEKLYLGSILGSVFIIAGLYIVLFGKGREGASVKLLPLESKTSPILLTGVSSEIKERTNSENVSQSAV